MKIPSKFCWGFSNDEEYTDSLYQRSSYPLFIFFDKFINFNSLS